MSKATERTWEAADLELAINKESTLLLREKMPHTVEISHAYLSDGRVVEKSER